jgi:hypothetical protein
MNNTGALEILDQELAIYRSKPYSELQKLVTCKPIGKEVRAYDDADYNVEVVIDWSRDPGGNIKVLAFIEDGEMRSFIPLAKSFIKTPDDEFTDEH